MIKFQSNSFYRNLLGRLKFNARSCENGMALLITDFNMQLTFLLYVEEAAFFENLPLCEQ